MFCFIILNLYIFILKQTILTKNNLDLIFFLTKSLVLNNPINAVHIVLYCTKNAKENYMLDKNGLIVKKKTKGGAFIAFIKSKDFQMISLR